MTLPPLLKHVAAATMVLGLAGQSALACTGIVLHADDGTTVAARTMEFGLDLESDLVAVPAGTEFTTLALNPDESGFTYTTKYGFGGANAFSERIIIDGLNTEGLYFGVFYFAGAVKLEELTLDNQDYAISSEELGNWVLGQFATVEEVRAAIPHVAVVGTDIEQIGGPAPVHYAVTDATGDAVVIEYTSAGLRIHDNTVNAVTNNPPYDWHLTNLQNYIGLGVDNRDEITVGNQVLKPFGQGTGMAGLPGDFTSPSRFVRAVAYANSALKPATADDAIFEAFHILNNFDIPKGAVREQHQGQAISEYTLWTAASDTKNRIYYFKSYGSQQVEKVDIRAAVEGLEAPKALKVNNTFAVSDRTSDF